MKNNSLQTRRVLSLIASFSLVGCDAPHQDPAIDGNPVEDLQESSELPDPHRPTAKTLDWAASDNSNMELEIPESNDLSAPSEFRGAIMEDAIVGIQLADGRHLSPGDWAKTFTLEGGGGYSDWACDGDCYDPDAARLELDTVRHQQLRGRDIRVCIQASDGGFKHTGLGPLRCTPWASVGGGVSGVASDGDSWDPDSYRVKVETRRWPSDASPRINYRLRIRAMDRGRRYIWSRWTPWSSQGGGRTDWACDSDCYDPDGFEIELDVRDAEAWDMCSVTNKCQAKIGDCDSNDECVPGTYCKPDVGLEYGYPDNEIDVCVDR